MRRTQQYQQAPIGCKKNKTVLCSFFFFGPCMPFVFHALSYLEVGWLVVLRSQWLAMAFWVQPFWNCYPSPWETEHVGNWSNGSVCMIWYTWRCLVAFVWDKMEYWHWPCVSLNGIFFCMGEIQSGVYTKEDVGTKRYWVQAPRPSPVLSHQEHRARKYWTKNKIACNLSIRRTAEMWQSLWE